jgi:cyclopropane-fatty-acyl-phospholipid synthase
MIEHVGESRIDEYARAIAGALEPGGLVLNHGITWVENEVHIGAEFSLRYVFPDAELPPLSRVIAAFERAGLEPRHVENLHSHYSETLRHWAERLDRNREEAERLAGPERVRVWRLYLRAARNGFERGLTSVFQTLLGGAVTEPPASSPTAATRPRTEQLSRIPRAPAGHPL